MSLIFIKMPLHPPHQVILLSSKFVTDVPGVFNDDSVFAADLRMLYFDLQRRPHQAPHLAMTLCS